jgi:hypothetical protein
MSPSGPNIFNQIAEKGNEETSWVAVHIFIQKGSDNKVADALSRIGSKLCLNAISSVVPIWVQEVVNSYHNDPSATAPLQELAVTSPNAQGYALSEGLVRFRDKIWVGTNTALQTKLISSFHSSALGGHSGIQTTYQRLKKMFYWTGMKEHVDSFVKQCSVCQKDKHELC